MIPVSQPSITDLEKRYVSEAMESGWISSGGPFVARFEEAWAKRSNAAYGRACTSGTTALQIALRALGIQEGDEVIVPEFTMIASAWAVSYCGAKPVFVDCSSDDLNINVKLIEEKITSKTKAIMPVHIYGRQCDMDAIMQIAFEYNLFVVEDSAESHGVPLRGDIACFSFFGNKIISTGEGGMCVTNNERLARQIDHLRAMAFDNEHTFLHKKIGYNFRMTNLQAAVGLAQVERFDEILTKRFEIQALYDKLLPKEIQMPERDVLWMYDIAVPADYRDRIRRELKELGVDTRPFFRPMSEQPMYFEYGHTKTNAHDWSRKGFYLPTFTDLSEGDIHTVCAAVEKVL